MIHSRIFLGANIEYLGLNSAELFSMNYASLTTYPRVGHFFYCKIHVPGFQILEGISRHSYHFLDSWAERLFFCPAVPTL
jgi:hypothetical protein